jgi:hypothetical protein
MVRRIAGRRRFDLVPPEAGPDDDGVVGGGVIFVFPAKSGFGTALGREGG